MPTTTPDIVLTPADTAVVIDPLANDSGEGLVLESFTQPAHGTLVANPDGTLTYTPAPGFAGVDSFGYTVRDATGSTATGSVIVSVLAPNQPPVATDDGAATAAGTAVEIPVLANDTDPDGDALRLLAIGQPAHGTASFVAPDRIRYLPQPGFSGIDRFVYTIGDGNGGVATGTVTVRVAGANRDPVAPDVEVETTDGTPLVLDLLARASDPDGDPLHLEALGVPRHGRITVNPDRTVTYTPQSGWSGTDSFAWTVGDGRGGLATGTVRVRVVRPNLPPAASDVTLTTPQDTPIAFDPLATASDPDGDPLRLSGFTLPRHGRVGLDTDGGLVYTPDPGFSGEDSFTWTIDDGRAGIATGTVRITVTPAEPPAEVFANGFRFRRRLLLPARQQASEVIEGFVLLVKEAGDWLKSVADGGQIESPDGFDIRFELEDGTKLAHEIERYDPVTGALVAWVRIPSWDVATSLILFLYYGKAGLTAAEADPAATWQDHLAVWDPVTGRDRSGQGRDLTANGTFAAGAGGARFDGTADLRATDATWLDGHAALTVDLLVTPDAAMVGSDRRFLSQGPHTQADGQHGLLLRYDTSGFRGGAPNVIAANIATTGGVVRYESEANLHSSERQYLHFVWQSGALPALFRNGRRRHASWTGVITADAVEENQASEGVTQMSIGASFSLGVGALATALALIGTVEIAAVRADAPTPTRLRLEAANRLEPEAFYGLGDAERPGDEPAPVAVPLYGQTRPATPITFDPFAIVGRRPDTELDIAGLPAHGTGTVIGDLLQYVPDAGFLGRDRFRYALVRNGRSSSAPVTVDVAARTVTDRPGSPPPPTRTVTVTDDATLAAALAAARPGDRIVLAAGNYSGFTVTANGTADAPIVIAGPSERGARVTGPVTLSGQHLWLHGLDFVGGGRIRLYRAAFCTLTRNLFTVTDAVTIVQSHDNRIGFNSFLAPGDTASTDDILFKLSARNDGKAGHYSTGNHIYNNYFSSGIPSGKFESHAIYIGESEQPAYPPLGTIIEYNLFDKVQKKGGVYIKVGGNTVRYNTFVGPDTGPWKNTARAFMVRQSGGNSFLGNIAVDSQGFIGHGPDNVWIGNRVEGSGSFKVMAGQPTTNHPPAENHLFAHNVGTIEVGFDDWYNSGQGPITPARDTRIEAHGPATAIRLAQHQTGTVISATSGTERIEPYRLERDEVGVDGSSRS